MKHTEDQKDRANKQFSALNHFRLLTVNVVVEEALIKDDRGRQCLDEP